MSAVGGRGGDGGPEPEDNNFASGGRGGGDPTRNLSDGEGGDAGPNRDDNSASGAGGGGGGGSVGRIRVNAVSSCTADQDRFSPDYTTDAASPCP